MYYMNSDNNDKAFYVNEIVLLSRLECDRYLL